MQEESSLEVIIRSYRSEDEAGKFAELLAINAIDVRDLALVLEFFQDLEAGALLRNHSDVQIALLTGEVQAYLQFQSQRIALIRGHAFERLSEVQSLASIGSELGMTKQSVFKVIRDTRNKEGQAK